MGGILRLWAVLPSDITVSGNQVTIASDVNVIDIYIREDSSSFSEDLSTSFAGKVYKVEISAIVPCDTSESLKQIADMERRCKYLVIYQDGNGFYKLAGTTEVPLRFSAKATTGSGASGLNHYAITFEGKQRNRAIFIDNPFA